MASAGHTFGAQAQTAPPIAAPDDVGDMEAACKRDADHVAALMAAGGFRVLPFAPRRAATALRPAYS